MFEVLIASGAHLDLRARWMTTSVATHGMLVALALATTGKALETRDVTAADPTMLLFVPKPPPPPPPPEARPEPQVRQIVVAEPPPKGFQTIAAPKDIPTVIPPVDLTQRALDPRDFTGRGVEGGVGDGVIGGTGPVAAPDAGALDAIYEATTRDERFEPASLLSQPVPRYPPALAAIGVEGRVKVEFVIDTAGQVEPASVRVLESSHPAFEDAARATVVGASFRPARLSTRPVRQLTRQAIRFVATK